MSLTLGSGPLNRRRRGTFNFDIDASSPQHIIYIEDVSQRVRAVFNGETVLDTRRAKVLYESNIPGQWYIPAADVRGELLTPTQTSTHCPFKGDASYWTLSVGDRTEPDVCWGYPTPTEAVAEIEGMRAFYAGRMDAWFEEDEQVFGHPRDPYHRVDARRSSDRVTVRVGGEAGEIVAETDKPVKVFETSLPARWYVPLDAVRPEVLTRSDTTTVCAYKGVASYYSVAGVADAAWVYEEPFADLSSIAGLLSFAGEGVVVTVEPAA
jgi:uncharacterized protein (DUF427 family)